MQKTEIKKDEKLEKSEEKITTPKTSSKAKTNSLNTKKEEKNEGVVAAKTKKTNTNSTKSKAATSNKTNTETRKLRNITLSIPQFFPALFQCFTKISCIVY